MAMTAASNGFNQMIVPLENAQEAAVVADIEVFGVGSLAQAAGFLSGQLELETTTVDIDELFNVSSNYEVDFSDVKYHVTVHFARSFLSQDCYSGFLTQKRRFQLQK
ncbi:MAG: hypothetical protein GY786_05080 [Proteobacteria bacterium]|nr:hypothetical protein [Pseudomonadota bacterium]